MKVQPGSKLLIYLIGILTVLAVRHWQVLIIIGFGLLFLNIFLKKFREVWQRLCVASPFLLTAVILGFFHKRGGWVFGRILVLKLVNIVFLNNIVFSNFTEKDLIVGMGQFGIPQIIRAIILFIFRYRELLKEEINQLKLARKLRGGSIGLGWFNLQEYLDLGQVIGAGLIRALDRGDRIYQAMCLRGLRIRTLVQSHKNLYDNWLLLVLMGLMSGVIILLDKGGIF